MAKVAEPWNPGSHEQVVHKLRDNLKKLGINYKNYAAEARIRLGPHVRRRMDLVSIAGKRTRRG